MEHDIIAYVYPHNDVDGSASRAIEANPRYMPPRLQRSRVRHSRRERESTEPLENQGASALDYLPSLEVRFSNIPRTNRGLVFGFNPNCDVVLDLRVISNCHFSLTFDQHHRPIVKDWGSLGGTQVTYNDKGRGKRRDFQWIVNGHDIPGRMKRIIITAADAISFQIVVPYHNITSPAYIASVNKFCQGTATAEGLLDDLGIANPETRSATGVHTPDTGAIYLKKKLGEGAFGVVTHLWNVSTGSERVVKTPSASAIRSRQVDYNAWQREARIMGQVSHPHIVRLLESFFTPYPELYLEYVPLGPLDDQEDISYDETWTIVHQCLSALAYLHEDGIAHRDIKPANILVQHRFEGDIWVKLGDFGLSRDSSELMTFCGTRRYIAPEIYSESQRSAGQEERMGYTAAVDIWSLGVVACELTYGLPQYGGRYRGFAWCERIVKWLPRKLEASPSNLGQLLSNTMLILSPEPRFSASDCYDVMADMDMAGAENGDFHISARASYPEGETQTTLRCHTENSGTEDPTIMATVSQPESLPDNNATISPSFVRSGAVPPESFSSSSNMSREGNGASEAAPSSAIRRYTRQDGHELTQFLEDYSADPFNSLFVGSSLASQFRERGSDDWASQFSQDSMHQGQAWPTGAQAGQGSGLARSSIPRSEREGWRLNNANSLKSLDDYDEMAEAAMMLQAIGRDLRKE